MGGARVARTSANNRAVKTASSPPYAPSAAAAPIVTLGFRELAADVFFVRMVGYFGAGDTDAFAVADLSEAIATLDPTFRRNYDVGPIAMQGAKRGVDNSIHLRAIALLEQARAWFPTTWKYPNIEGQIYLVDLQTKDPAQRREWDQKGALLLESAARKPMAPSNLGLQAAILQTKFGQQQRAIQNLRELFLITEDPKSKQQLLDKLAELSKDNNAEIAAELLQERRSFEQEWERTRNSVPQTFYVLIGAPLGSTFDLTSLATGGDMIGSEFERLEPLDDPMRP
jgi:hypothetical protein